MARRAVVVTLRGVARANASLSGGANGTARTLSTARVLRLRLECARHGREHRFRVRAAARNVRRPSRARLATGAGSSAAPRRLTSPAT
jgi:hypothetical protein